MTSSWLERNFVAQLVRGQGNVSFCSRRQFNSSRNAGTTSPSIAAALPSTLHAPQPRPTSSRIGCRIGCPVHQPRSDGSRDLLDTHQTPPQWHEASPGKHQCTHLRHPCPKPCRNILTSTLPQDTNVEIPSSTSNSNRGGPPQLASLPAPPLMLLGAAAQERECVTPPPDGGSQPVAHHPLCGHTVSENSVLSPSLACGSQSRKVAKMEFNKRVQ